MTVAHPSSPPSANRGPSSAPISVARLQGRAIWSPDAEEVAEIFTQYRPYVGKIARRILGAGHDVEDVIQDVFVATVQTVHHVQDPARLKGWLATVTTRTARRRRFGSTVDIQTNRDDPEEFLSVCAEGPSPESTAHIAGRIQHLLELPEHLRTPWMLRHVEGKTLEDIAKQCDCSTSTAQRRIRAVDGRLTIPPSARNPILR